MSWEYRQSTIFPACRYVGVHTKGGPEKATRLPVEEMEGPLRLLEDNGYVRSVGVQHTARTGRKPSDTFLVNPAVWQPSSVNSVERAV